MGLLEYKFTLFQYINQMLLVTCNVSLNSLFKWRIILKYRSKLTSTMCYGFYIWELLMWLGKWFYSTDSKTQAALHCSTKHVHDTAITKTSESRYGGVTGRTIPWDVCTPVSTRRMAEGGSPILLPGIPFIKTAAPSEGEGMSGKHKVLMFWTPATNAWSPVAGRTLHPLLRSPGRPCLHKEPELDFLDRLIMLGWNSVWRRACFVRWSLRMKRFSQRGHRNCFSPVWVR